jgi:hypothetical protein
MEMSLPNPNADVPKATKEWFTASIPIDNVIGEDATCIQRSKKGLIPHQIANLNEVVTPGRNIDDFSQGADFSQEFGIPEESPYSNDSPFSLPQSTGDFYQDNVALIGILSHHAAQDKELMAKLNQIMRRAYAKAFTAIQEHRK